MSWDKSTLHAEIHAKERVRLVLCAAVLDIAANEVIYLAAVADRASEGLHLTGGMRILPHTTLASRAKIVDHTIFIEVVLIEELRWNFSQ